MTKTNYNPLTMDQNIQNPNNVIYQKTADTKDKILNLCYQIYEDTKNNQGNQFFQLRINMLEALYDLQDQTIKHVVTPNEEPPKINDICESYAELIKENSKGRILRGSTKTHNLFPEYKIRVIQPSNIQKTKTSCDITRKSNEKMVELVGKNDVGEYRIHLSKTALQELLKELGRQ